MKRLFGLLTFILIGLINFGYCTNNWSFYSQDSYTEFYFTDLNKFSNFSFSSDCNLSFTVYCKRGNSQYSKNMSASSWNASSLIYSYCDYNSAVKITYCDGGSYSLSVSFNPLADCPSCTPQYTSQECQSVYGLVSSGSLASCENDLSSCNSSLNTCQANTSGFNELLNNCSLSLNACNSSLTSCLQSNCPEIDYTGDLQRSNVYINDILHPGRQFVNINIPDYIFWDYSVGDDDFNIYVGSGYDVDYINSIVDINSYRPTSDDFTNVFVSGLTLVFPYIFVALLILFIWKLVKRIFK